MDDYEKVADWIINVCDDPQEEVAWLLAMLDESGKAKPTFRDTYEEVLDWIDDLKHWGHKVLFVSPASHLFESSRFKCSSFRHTLQRKKEKENG